MSGSVQTVLGKVDPRNLGYTLTHEHLCMDFSYFYRKPPQSLSHKFNYFFIDNNISNVGYIRQYPYSSRTNLVLNDKDAQMAVYEDVQIFKDCGGGTIVENSTEGLEGDIHFYKSISQKTGVNIIAGTGFYIADLQPDNVLHYRTEDIYDHMLSDFTKGFRGSDIKAGFMGEIASVWPIKDFERKVIRAVGELQPQIGCGVSFHPHREPDAPFEIIRLYLEAGGRADKAVMSHLDRTLLDDEKLLEFANLGTYCQFDLFGVEVSYYQLCNTIDMPSDAQRLDKMKLLRDNGKTDRLLMSHDIHTKHRLINYGGHGYSHILNNIFPRMVGKGWTPEELDMIGIQNPAEWLTIKNPA